MVSPDGNYIWNGTQWVRNLPAKARTSTTTQGPRSPDGKHTWNGVAWLPVPIAVPKKKHGKRNLALIIAAPFVIFAGVMALAFHGTTDTIVVYSVTSNDPTAFAVVYADAAGAGAVTKKGVDLPFTVSVKAGTGMPVTVGGIGANDGVVTCEISVNGQIIGSDVGSGSIGCSASATVPGG